MNSVTFLTSQHVWLLQRLWSPAKLPRTGYCWNTDYLWCVLCIQKRTLGDVFLLQNKLKRGRNWRAVWVWWRLNSMKKKKEKAFTIDDEVESLKQSFTVIHLWQKMWAIILDVRSKPKYQVCMHCMCAEYTNWSASAQIQFTEPYSSRWLQNNTNSSSFFAFFVEAKAQRISIFFKSKERIVFSNSFSRMQITFYQDGVT